MSKVESQAQTILIAGSYWPPHPGDILPLLEKLIADNVSVEQILVSISSAEGSSFRENFASKSDTFEAMGGERRHVLFQEMIKCLKIKNLSEKIKALLSKVTILPEGHDHRDNAAGNRNANTWMGLDPSKGSVLLKRFQQKHSNLIYVIGQDDTSAKELDPSDESNKEAINLAYQARQKSYRDAGVHCKMLCIDRSLKYGMESNTLRVAMANKYGARQKFQKSSFYSVCPEYYSFVFKHYDNNFINCQVTPHFVVSDDGTGFVIDMSANTASFCGCFRELGAWSATILVGSASIATGIYAGVASAVPTYLMYVAIALAVLAAVTMAWGSVETSSRKKSLLFAPDACLGESKIAPIVLD